MYCMMDILVLEQVVMEVEHSSFDVVFKIQW